MFPKPSWLKSNKSHTSVDNSSGQSSPVPSVNEFQNPNGQQQAQLGQQPSLQQSPLGVAQQQQQNRPQQHQQQQQQQQQYPQRTASTSHSHRLSSHDQLQGYQQHPGPPDASPGFNQPRPNSQQLPAPVYVQEQPKKSRFSRIAAGLTGHKEEDPSKQANKTAIGRRQSTRGRENRPQEYQPQDAPLLNTPSQQYHQRHGSQQQLPTSVEQDEDSPGLDPFLQQDPNTPQVPPKDHQYPQHPQQFIPSSHQEQYNRPPLDRASTESNYQKQGGVDRYSADQQQGPQQPQQHPNQQQYQNYQPIVQQPQGSEGYQTFVSQPAPSPRLGNAQLHGQDIAQQQRSYYQYQQQQASQQSQGQLPQEGHSQNAQAQQQQQFAPPPQSQPQQTQDFRQQQVHPLRTASQHQPELQHPQAARGVPHIVQQGQPTDTQQLQQLRPPSSQQQPQPAPPSPLQHQSYQPYDQQQSQQSQASDSPTSKISVQTQSQDNMAPSSQSNGRLRKVADGGQQQSTTSSREPSLLQQPTTQGQPQGQAPVSPGVAMFGANVVPTASQGQPYRGDKQNGETGRATPPPRSATSDMTDEEIEKMMKDHEVLREKYQKVKRYFFEQQTQVHQLQNTLANQRLSLSRTSWDDSEYSTRFSRLDGLIAQLSFSIRKDWKSIPPFLQPVVNKNAVEIGKQEMTAVGRAFISHWLVENIFEKYFHPDLEPGFSTQLQMIQLNIRKFAPSCHSTEDEDSLVAKVINWRLATLEGLSDLLKAPQAELNRQKLTETLNEKLIASLQVFLNDPAPPDLAGGVPMIVELAVSIAQHLPLESREVHIEYFSPGHGILPDFMKIESGIPPLTSPIAEPEEADRVSLKSVASKLDDNASVGDQDIQGQQGSQPLKEDKKRSFFGGLGASKKPTTAPASLGKRESSLGQGGSQQSLAAPPGSSSGTKEEQLPPRVRLAVGVAVQIRGKSVLIKAPVFST